MESNLGKVYCYSVLVIFSLLYFTITATTFTSLGVVLPAMVQQFGWSWTGAGLGFTLLGLGCGLSSYFPTIIIRKFGVRTTLFIGGVILTIAFACLFNVHTLYVYLMSTILLGIGFSLVATMPGTYVIGRLFEKQHLIFGIYFFIGGLGGVIGPAIYFISITLWHNWRMHWAISGISMLVLIIAAIFILKHSSEEEAHTNRINELDKKRKKSINDEELHYEWTAREAFHSVQFYIISASYVAFLLCGITVNSFAVAHITEHGYSQSLAAGLLSTQAFINSFSRVGGGFLREWISSKSLLVISLLMLTIGMFSLGLADSQTTLIIFTIGVGIGYGMTFLSTSVLLNDYFGRQPHLELFSVMNLISTLACFGPVLGGKLKDVLGNFSITFIIFAIFPLVILLLALLMKRPVPRKNHTIKHVNSTTSNLEQEF